MICGLRRSVRGEQKPGISKYPACKAWSACQGASEFSCERRAGPRSGDSELLPDLSTRRRKVATPKSKCLCIGEISDRPAFEAEHVWSLIPTTLNPASTLIHA